MFLLKKLTLDEEYKILHTGIGGDYWIPVFETEEGNQKLRAHCAAFSQSLDQGLDSKTLRSNLKQIKSSYENWKNAALKKTDKTVAKPEVSNQQTVNPFTRFIKSNTE